MDSISYQPIGIFHCQQTQPVDSPRQGVLAEGSRGWLELNKDISIQSLQDLEGFERVWILYSFHKNTTWKPMVRPPRGAEKKRGVFATRSPYRPNGIGLSCVKLLKVDKHRLEIGDHDLLDETPVLDIKPYIELSDAFFETRQGWLEGLKEYAVLLEIQALEKLKWLEIQINKPLRTILKNQLSVEPTNTKIKRVKEVGSFYELSYKTWRIKFCIEQNSVRVLDVGSGYSQVELDSLEDPFGDLSIHKKFLCKFQ